MTPFERERVRELAADRQRLKRQRRAEAGFVKVECWLSAEEAAWTRAAAAEWGDSLADTVRWCVRYQAMTSPKPRP